jgi:hypothetical protein
VRGCSGAGRGSERVWSGVVVVEGAAEEGGKLVCVFTGGSD